MQKESKVPALRIAMRQIREVLRLKDECALTYSQIARSLRISKGSVANYLRHAEAAGLTHEEAARLDDAALTARLQPAAAARSEVCRTRFRSRASGAQAQGGDAHAALGGVP